MKQYIAALGLVIGAATQAAIIDHGTYTEDTETGLKWLDLTLTRGLSYNEAIAETTKVTGHFRGCRSATTPEIQNLLPKLGLSPTGGSCFLPTTTYCGSPIAGQAEALENAIRLLGDTQDARLDASYDLLDVSPSGAGAALGHYAAGSLMLTDGELVGRVNGTPASDSADDLRSLATNLDDDIKNPDYGTVLVCDTWPIEIVENPVTIDFEELSAGTDSFVISKDYEFSGWGTYGGGQYGGAAVVDASGNKKFAAWGYGQCGSWYPEASISFARADGGPFALYELQGVPSIMARTANGALISGTQSDLGAGAWLSLSWASAAYSAVHACTPYITSSIQIAVDNIIVSEELNSAIDFEPADPANVIRPKDDYQVSIGILTTSIASGDSFDFDATKVLPASVAFGPNGAPNVITSQLLDLDGDTDSDMLVGFEMADTGISCFETNVKITGSTATGGIFAGKDSVTRMNCEKLVDIDFDPWSPANEIQPENAYLLAVGIKSTSIAQGDAEDFNATMVDPQTLKFGPAAGPSSAIPLSFDFDGDGDTDMLFGFRAEESGIACGDTDVMISGETYGGQQFIGSDAITTTECSTGGCHP